MISRALDSNNDLVIKSGVIQTISNGEEVLQHVRTRLLFYKYEWFLNKNAGVPYFTEIFNKPVDLGKVESVLKSVILKTEGVLKLIEFSTEFNNETRVLKVSFSAETNWGELNSNEVFLNV